MFCKYNYFLSYRGLSYYYFYLCSLTRTQQYHSLLLDMDSVTWVQIPDKDVCVWLRTHTLGNWSIWPLHYFVLICCRIQFISLTKATNGEIGKLWIQTSSAQLNNWSSVTFWPWQKRCVNPYNWFLKQNLVVPFSSCFEMCELINKISETNNL